MIRGEKLRHSKISFIFKTFDIDNSGYIEANELKELGNARRVLGQKTVRAQQEFDK